MDDSVLFEAEDSFADMKVAELKSELKARSLSTAGTKSELLARLQEAVAAAKDSSLSLTEETDGNEDEILNDDIPDSPTKETGLFSEKSPLSLKPSLNETKPMKKRMIVTPSNGTAPPEKKLCLNRTTTVIVPLDIPPLAESTHQKITMAPVTIAASEEVTGTKKAVSSIKIMTSQERLAQRAERFHIASTGTAKLKVASKETSALPATAAKSNVKAPITHSTAPDMDKLKKRAERFGVVSTVLKKIEEKDKVKKRQMRFGSSVALLTGTTNDETLQKKMRVQKFGIS